MAAVLPSSAGAATPISPDSLGVNFTGSPPDLATASAAGVGLARDQVIEGTNTDAIVELTAAADLRLYPMLGLPVSHGAAADATAMAAFVTSFAQRYGPGGSFWAQHPELPYLPVESYEIGNEPDITPTEPADETSLHYANPADYAEVYEAARTALHQVDPTAQAVVGGMLDSGAITLDTAEQYLAGDRPDGCGRLPPVSVRRDDDGAGHDPLRQWLDANGDSNVPLDINEFGAADGVTPGIAAWGAEVAQYTQWALCTPGLNVENVQAFWWGGIPIADTDPWFSMVDSELSESPLGTAYLGEVQALTTQGCPAAPASTPPAATHPATNPAAPTPSERKRSTASARRSRRARRLPTTSPVASVGTRPHLGAKLRAAPPSGGDRASNCDGRASCQPARPLNVSLCMRRVAIALALLLALPASAEASKTIAPPGNSGVGQYVETVPTAGGGRPTSTVHPGGGAVGHPGGPGGTSSGGGAGGGSAITPSTQHALAAQGPAGVAAAALAEATAPQRPRSSVRIELHRTGFVGLGGLGEPGIVARRERRQGPDRFDERGRPRTPVAHRPDRQRPRRRGARARASPPRELITPAACVFVCLLSWSCCSVWARPLGKLAPSVSRSGSAPTPP